MDTPFVDTPFGPPRIIGEKKPIKENHIKEFGGRMPQRRLVVGCPGGVPGTNSGRPRDSWDIWA